MADIPCPCEHDGDACLACVLHAHGCCEEHGCTCDHGMTWPAAGPWEALFRFYGLMEFDGGHGLRTFSYRGRPGMPVVMVDG